MSTAPVVLITGASRGLGKNAICGAFLRCVLLARLPNSMLCLRSLRCYALNCIHIWYFCKGLSL